MRMVASAKLHHTQGMTEAFLQYYSNLQSIVKSLGDSPTPNLFSIEEERFEEMKGAGHTLLIPISSNSGLCGAFNNNIGKATFKRIQELEQQGKQVSLLPIGKKIAHELQKTGRNFNKDFVQLLDKLEKSNTIADISALVAHAIELHQHKEIDSVEILYHHFKSMGVQTITNSSLLLDMPQVSTQKNEDWFTEPSVEELLTSLFPRLLNAQVYGILLDSLTSEHAARMLAMQTADDNANDLLKELTLLYNKTRQQSITNELIDIMSGKIGEH